MGYVMLIARDTNKNTSLQLQLDNKEKTVHKNSSGYLQSLNLSKQRLNSKELKRQKKT